ncbi:MAG: NADH:ubiquinone reductase (Na(+)-transporting) subunit C [Elusimicrobiota bacterium]
MHSTSYTLGFAAAVCVACSLVVSSAATLLRDRQDRNIEVDIQKNILRSVGFLHDPSGKPGPDEIRELYLSRIEALAIDRSGSAVKGKDPADLDPSSYLDPKKDPEIIPLYVRKDEGRVAAYAFPVAGPGLWSTVYGYLALEPDGDTVKGVTFYKHGETPGLGAEIEQAWFRENFVGKKVLGAEGELRSVSVVKGKVKDAVDADAAPHYVDGISGATLTGKGVTELLRAGLERYEPFLRKVRERNRKPSTPGPREQGRAGREARP